MLPITRRILQFRRLFAMSCKSEPTNPYIVYSNEDSPNSKSRLPESEFLRFDSKNIARFVTLDRPSTLHALTYSMVNDLSAVLRLWNSSDSAQVIVLQGGAIPSGKKSFCAGGDVVQLFQSRGYVRDQCEFFRREYALNHLIATSTKPIVSVLDGIVMGGGAGLSIHGQFRIATENTVFAMPETAIGFWPDVGSSFFLPRLEGGLGYYLGLTGARLKGQDVYHAGLATHFIPSHRIPDALESLASSLPIKATAEHVNTVLNQFSDELVPFTLEPLQDSIDRAFLAPNMSTILSRLREMSGSKDSVVSKWASETINLLTGPALSPTALHTTLSLLQRGSLSSLKTALRTELSLAQHYVDKVDDLYKGIDAKLVQKHGNPKWTPETIDQVDPNFIRTLFSKPADSITLTFSNDTDFEQYPHAHFALPSSQQIRGLLLSKYRDLKDRSELINVLCKSHFGENKLGICPHLERIVSKHVSTRLELDKQGHIPTSNLNWK